MIHTRFDTQFGAGGKTIAKLADSNDYCHFYRLTRLFSYEIREQKKKHKRIKCIEASKFKQNVTHSMCMCEREKKSLNKTYIESKTHIKNQMKNNTRNIQLQNKTNKKTQASIASYETWCW